MPAIRPPGRPTRYLVRIEPVFQKSAELMEVMNMKIASSGEMYGMSMAFAFDDSFKLSFSSQRPNSKRKK